MPSRVPGLSYDIQYNVRDVLVLVLQYGTSQFGAVPSDATATYKNKRSNLQPQVYKYQYLRTRYSCFPVQVPCTWYYSTSKPGINVRNIDTVVLVLVLVLVRYCSKIWGFRFITHVSCLISRIYAIFLPGEQGNRLTANRSDKGDSGLGIRDDMISERSQIGESA